MKLLFSLLLLLSPYIDSAPSESVVEWATEQTYDFGLLNQGVPSFTEFPFKNVSGEPIVIDNIRTECGCTAATWDTLTIQPDSIGTVTLEFDAAKLGYFYKKARVFFSNQRKPEILYIEGEVE